MARGRREGEEAREGATCNRAQVKYICVILVQSYGKQSGQGRALCSLCSTLYGERSKRKRKEAKEMMLRARSPAAQLRPAQTNAPQRNLAQSRPHPTRLTPTFCQRTYGHPEKGASQKISVKCKWDNALSRHCANSSNVA